MIMIIVTRGQTTNTDCFRPEPGDGEPEHGEQQAEQHGGQQRGRGRGQPPRQRGQRQRLPLPPEEEQTRQPSQDRLHGQTHGEAVLVPENLSISLFILVSIFWDRNNIAS